MFALGGRAWIDTREDDAVVPRADSAAPQRRPAARGRASRRTFDRLTIKLAVGVALLVIIPLGLGLHAMIQHYRDRGIATRAQAAARETRILEAALRFEVMDDGHVLLESILADIGSQPEVHAAMILNHKGEVRVASRREQLGRVLVQESPECMICHAQEPEDRNLSVFMDDERGGILRSVRPITNESRCHECHNPEDRLNGILILDISLAALQEEFERDVMWIVGATIVLALLLLVGVGLFVRHLILKRLARLGHTARAVAAGKLSERAESEGDDVITHLASDFNSMTDSVASLLTEVREQEAQLTSLMNSLDDGLVVLDRQSRVVACNQSFCRRMGMPPESVRGARCRGPEGGLLPCCQSASDCPASRCLATGSVQRAVFHVQNGDGRLDRVEEVYASPVLGLDGQVMQVVELWRDITERTKEEGRLAEIERMVSLGTLASGFSHEVNTPLASMLTCAEAVVSRIDESGIGDDGAPMLTDIRQHAEIIRTQVLRCRDITRQFLRFSRGIPPSIEPLDLGAAVAEVVALVAATARQAGVVVELESPAGLPSVKTNTEVVHHVMLNLLVNAIQSCGEEGGAIHVRFVAGAEVGVQVSDTGCGIPADLQGQIFEPLYSRKPHGTGLGLFLARSFMRQFDGEVELVSSEVGKGSCFQATFARMPEQVS